MAKKQTENQGEESLIPAQNPDDNPVGSVTDHPFYEAWLNGGDLRPPLHMRDDIADLDPSEYHKIFIVYGMLCRTHNARNQEPILAAYDLDVLTYENACHLLKCLCAEYFDNLCLQKDDDKPVYLPVHTPHSFKFFNPVCHMAIIKTCESRDDTRNILGSYFCMLDCYNLDDGVKMSLYDRHNDFQLSRISRDVPDEVWDIIRRADNLAEICREKINRNAVDEANLPPVQKPNPPRDRKNSRGDTIAWSDFSEVTTTNLCCLNRETLVKLFRAILKEAEDRHFVTFQSDDQVSGIIETWLDSFAPETEATINGNPEGIRDICIFALSTIKAEKGISKRVLSRKTIIDMVQELLPNAPVFNKQGNVNRIVTKVTEFLNYENPS